MSKAEQDAHYGSLLVESEDLAAERACLASKIRRIFDPLSEIVKSTDKNTSAVYDEANFPRFRKEFMEAGGEDLSRYLEEYENALLRISRMNREISSIRSRRRVR